MLDHTERRERVRVIYETYVLVTISGFPKILGQTTDISMTGLFISTDFKVPVGVECNVLILLKERTSKLTIETYGTVSRCDGNGIAIKFKDVLEWWAIFSIYSHLSGPEKIGYSVSI